MRALCFYVLNMLAFASQCFSDDVYLAHEVGVFKLFHFEWNDNEKYDLLVGLCEVTNAAWKRFYKHDVDGKPMPFIEPHIANEHPRLPVHGLAIQQYLQFCNEVSRELGLTSQYSIVSKTSGEFWSITQYDIKIVPLSNGVRMLSPQEWKELSRRGLSNSNSSLPEPTDANFYDAAANEAIKAWDPQVVEDPDSLVPADVEASLIEAAIEKASHITKVLHNDGYAETAPCASFKPSTIGLYDIFGNVSETCVSTIESKLKEKPDVIVWQAFGGNWLTDIDDSRILDDKGATPVSAFCNCSGAGLRLCIPVSDASAFANAHGFTVSRDAPEKP